ncbi:carbohydrate binding domain-containing protein, partial [Streptomyces sp. NPDC127084]|uniref:carbohydrate binding domain-containing protein n=1 Tax=Streptomyces sp. NPDC127084 TaxID=3347133 RepID=UPI0036666FB3
MPVLRNRRLWAGVAMAALALSFAGTGQASAADINNAKNAGFESSLTNWTCTAGSGTTVSSPVHGGAAALKGTPAGQDNAQCVQSVAVKPNSTYTLSAWVQGGYSYLGVTGTGTTDVSTWTPDTTTWK